jgi:hypothetical protein
MGMSVVTVATGGMPVVESTNGYGLPVTEAANKFGMAVTKVVGKPGLPVIFVSPPLARATRQAEPADADLPDRADNMVDPKSERARASTI